MNSRFETFLLTHVARTKLSRAASHPDYNLRLLLGHANVLDKLMLDMLHTQEDWKRKLGEDLSVTKQDTSASQEDETEDEEEEEMVPAPVTRRIRWANDVGCERQLLQAPDTAEGDRQSASTEHHRCKYDDSASGLVQFDMLTPSESSDSDEWEEEASSAPSSPGTSEGEIEIAYDSANRNEWHSGLDDEDEEDESDSDDDDDGDDDYDGDEKDDDAFGFSLTRVPSHSHSSFAPSAELGPLCDIPLSSDDSATESDSDIAAAIDTEDDEDEDGLALPLQRHHSLPDLLPSHAEGYDSTSSDDDDDDTEGDKRLITPTHLSFNVKNIKKEDADSSDEDEIEKQKHISISSPSSSTSSQSSTTMPSNSDAANTAIATATTTAASTSRSSQLSSPHIQHSLVPCIVSAAV